MEMETITVLYLDKEVQNLNAFKATYRRFFKVLIAKTPKEALAVLNEHPVHVFISDQKLSEENNADFLKKVSEQFPDMINIIVTGYLEDEDLVNSKIAKGDVFRYLMKPWEDLEMKSAILDAYKVYQFLLEKKKELDVVKFKVSNNIKAPIANLEGLLSLATLEIEDTYALRDYFAYMSESIISLKEQLYKEEYLNIVD
jgi:response regulator RpfG family c-di-GMP phosphodiesterase